MLKNVYAESAMNDSLKLYHLVVSVNIVSDETWAKLSINCGKLFPSGIGWVKNLTPILLQ